jgi:hypothetical protein
MEVFPLNLAPESDEWEEIECDEADQNIATNSMFAPINMAN